MWWLRAIRSLPAFDAEYGERGPSGSVSVKRALLDRAVHLVGGDVHEALDADLAGDVAQHVGAVAVGAHELVGAHDRAVDVALGGEVHDGVVAVHGRRHRVAIADVAVDEREARASPSRSARLSRLPA